MLQESRSSGRKQNVTGDDIYDPSRSWLCAVAPRFRRVCLAETPIDGAHPGAAGDRDAAQLPLLRAGLPASGRGRSEPARRFRRLRRLRRFRNRAPSHAGVGLREKTVDLLALGRRLQSRRDGRHCGRLFSRQSTRPAGTGRPAGRRLCNPDALCAAADDHACRCSLAACACTGQAGSGRQAQEAAPASPEYRRDLSKPASPCDVALANLP